MERRNSDIPGYEVVHEELQDLSPRRRRKLHGSPAQAVNDIDHGTDHEAEVEAEDSHGTIMLNNTSTLNANAEPLFFDKVPGQHRLRIAQGKTRDTATETGAAILGVDGVDAGAVGGVGPVAPARKTKIKEKAPPQKYQ